MTKWITYAVVGILVLFSWSMYNKTEGKMQKLQQEINAQKDLDDPEDKVAKLETEYSSLEGEKTFNGILLTFLGAGLVGIFFVMTALPFFAQRMTESVFESGEMVEKDPLRDAHVLIAQGDYEGAIAAFNAAKGADPLNRLPWVEIAKIQKANLEDPAAAIQTLRDALESQSWKVDDAAFFMFRLVEVYDESMGDRATATAVLNQVIEQFPETRHSANATHQLHEWSNATTGNATTNNATVSSLEEEEAEFLKKLRGES